MKAILLCENDASVQRVYPARVIQDLTFEAGLYPQIFRKKDLLEDPAYFADVEYVFSTWGMPQMTEEEIALALPELKAVFYAAGTVQAFARPFIARGIRVFSAWAANGVPVAEYAVSQIILANKGFFQSCRKTRSPAGRDAAYAHFADFPGNYGCRVGLIGAGMIGSMVAEKLKGLNVEVVAFDPFLSDAKAAALSVRKVSLEELFSTCQTISNHLANNAQTKGMLNYGLFSLMRDNATFINTGRGAQVVEADLVRALQEKPGRTAILDVTLPEPPPEGSPFYSLPNVFLTPHIAGSSGNECYRMAEYMAAEFRLVRAGRQTRYEVTEAMLSTMA